MKRLLLLLVVPFLSFGQSLCDGVTTELISFNQASIDVVISTEDSPNFWCSYCGLVLMDNNDNIVAIENPYNGGSFYGLAGGYLELRTLEIISNINLPFQGELHAMSGLMPNVIVDENLNVNASNPIDMVDGDIPFIMCSWPLEVNLTYVPDDNFEQKLIDLGLDDILNDSVVTINISPIEELYVSNSNISNLTGIEDFISLQTLDCSFNNLSELDISQNAALKTLTGSFNNLSELNISNNPLLESIACSDNMIPALDVSIHEQLTYLDCHQNNLSELNVSNNAILTDLTCSFNNLSELDISNNLELYNFAIEGNDLSELDVSNNSFLMYLDCSSNNLSELDVINNTGLNFLFCNNNNLSCIQVWDINYAENNFIKDDDAIWSMDCEYENCVEVELGVISETCNNLGSVWVEFLEGGAPPYEINWQGVDTSSLSAGEYSVLITDDEGCSEVVFYSIEYDCDEVNIDEVFVPKTIIKTMDILGREATNKGFQLHIYDDGTVDKKYVIK